jgi:TfoX/Sxy family transcriptional regulator of competence genes
LSYDEALAERVREVVHERPGVVERKMFGGLGWLLAGNMACACMTDGLVVRIDPDETQAAIQEPHVRPFGRPGARPMRGFVLVEPEGVERQEDLARWVHAGAARASMLPPK